MADCVFQAAAKIPDANPFHMLGVIGVACVWRFRCSSAIAAVRLSPFGSVGETNRKGEEPELRATRFGQEEEDLTNIVGGPRFISAA